MYFADVTIINRGEHGDRFKNIQVHIGKNEGNHKRNPVCHDRVRHAGDGEAVRLQCNPPVPGRYVAVQMYGRGILTMCEVIVNSRIGELYLHTAMFVCQHTLSIVNLYLSIFSLGSLSMFCCRTA